MDDLETLRYPVGRFSRLTAPLDRATRSAHLDTIEQTPATFRSLVNGRSDAQLDTPYRPGGWTVRQVVHHVPDSHMNAYLRMKFAITEDAPAIKVNIASQVRRSSAGVGRRLSRSSSVSPLINFMARNGRPSGRVPRSWTAGMLGC